MTTLPASPSSANRIRYVHLASNELHALDMLSTTLLFCTDLPMSLADACDVLQGHGFARLRPVTHHGHTNTMAWDITFDGQAYLIRQYKNKGARL